MRRVAQGLIAGLLSLFALSVVAGVASGSTGTTDAAPVATSTATAPTTSGSSPTPQAAAASSPVAVTTAARRKVKVPAQPTRTAPTGRPTSRARITPTPTKPPARTPSPAPKPSPTHVALSLCGAPSNPWGFTFCGGSVIYSPPADICAYLNCIANFENGRGYVVQCADGTFSKSGGRQGACSYHGGERRALLK